MHIADVAQLFGGAKPKQKVESSNSETLCRSGAEQYVGDALTSFTEWPYQYALQFETNHCS